MNKTKKIVSIALTGALTISGMLSFVGCGKSHGPTDYTVWISNDSEIYGYYNEYNENPVFNYISEFMEFNGNKISLDFTAAPSTGAQDNLNTLLATGSYSDIMDVSMSTSSVVQLYESGAAMDITDYVVKYMPKYIEFLDEHPELKPYAVTYYDIDGDGELEERYFHLQATGTNIGEPWEGYLYRRDWLAKALNKEYTIDKNGNMVDDIVFPSYSTENGKYYKENIDPAWDGSDPVFISDWEWMFEQFTKANLIPNGGYCTSLFYYGYNPCGDLVSSFGGYETGALAKNKEGKAEFSGTSDNFRTYLNAMNTWHAKGWMDKLFSTHTNDMFWSIDSANVTQGKVGLWQGFVAQAGTSLQDSEFPDTEGAYVAPSRLPINDVYGKGTEACFSVEGENRNTFVPAAFLENGMEGSPWIITPTAAEKDLDTLFQFLAWTFDPEQGGLTLTAGLSDAQIEEAKTKSWGGIYNKFGISSMGEWKEDGKLYKDQTFVDDNSIWGPFVGMRFPSRGSTNKIAIVGTHSYLKAMDEWMLYRNLAFGKLDWLQNYMSSTEAVDYSAAISRLNDYSQAQLPKFIKGEKNLENDWKTYVSDMNKRGAQTSVELLNKLLNEFNA